MSIAPKIGCTARTLNEWVKRAEVDSGRRAGIPTEMAEKMRARERESRELRQGEADRETVRRTFSPANGILRQASACLAMAELDRRSKRWSISSTGIDVNTAASRSARCCRSPRRPTTIIWRSAPTRPGCRNGRAGTRRCGPRSGASSTRPGASAARGIWHQLRREGVDVARCTVARLMKDTDIQGILPGKPHRTTIPDKRQPCPSDKVNRRFGVPAPDQLWVSDVTRVATWTGFVHVAARRQNSPPGCFLIRLTHRRPCPGDRRPAGRHARSCRGRPRGPRAGCP